MPELPHLSFDGAARFGSADWKLGPLDAYGQGRPIAWIDDCFDKRCAVWAQERPAPTKLIPIDARRGLQDTHVEVSLAWVRALE